MTMVNKTIGTTASLFGAALTSMLVAPELQADVVSLSFSPSSAPYAGGSNSLQPILINEVGTNFSQWNDSVGRTMVAAGLSSIDVVQLSQTLSPNTFGGVGTLAFTGGSSGTVYIGFRSGGNVGWFSFSVAGFGTDIHYLEGGYGNAGENVHVGTVPAPGALALLALGAVGVRRNRKRVA